MKNNNNKYPADAGYLLLLKFKLLSSRSVGGCSSS